MIDRAHELLQTTRPHVRSIVSSYGQVAISRLRSALFTFLPCRLHPELQQTNTGSSPLTSHTSVWLTTQQQQPPRANSHQTYIPDNTLKHYLQSLCATKASRTATNDYLYVSLLIIVKKKALKMSSKKTSNLKPKYFQFIVTFDKEKQPVLVTEYPRPGHIWPFFAFK